MYNQEQWRHYNEMQNALITLAAKFVDEFCDDREDLTSVETCGNFIEIKTEAWYSGCGTETDQHSLPIHYLWTEDWMDLERIRQEEKRIERIVAEKKRSDDYDRKKVAKERKQYIELQAKYGGEL